MARKFGKINEIKVDPFAYNLGLIGESGVGKTTIIKEACERLANYDPESYMILNTGMEDGIDAVAGASYADIPDWDTLEEFVEDVVENKLTDYNSLRVVVFDTIDELFRITEPEVIRLHNRENPEKRVTSINSAFGGYQRGEDKAVEIVLEKIKALKDVGVSVWFVGHTKKRTLTDVVTGLEYDMLTTNMSNKYFNAIKTKLHVLGVASIDRDITQSKSGKKDFKGKEKVVGSVNSARRKITFRDDNFNIDSKSRFPNIIDEIEFTPEDLIKAIEDAIKSEFDKQKGGKTIEEVREIQQKEKDKKIEEEVIRGKAEIEAERLADAIAEISKFMQANKSKKDKLTPLLLEMKKQGVSKMSEITDLDIANALLDVCK